MRGCKPNRSMCNCLAKYAASRIDFKSVFTGIVPHMRLAFAMHPVACKRSYTMRCNALYFYFVTNTNRIGCIIICVYFFHHPKPGGDTMERLLLPLPIVLQTKGTTNTPLFYLKLYCMDTKHTAHNLPTK